MKNIFFLILSIVVLLLIPFSLAYLSSLNSISSIWESILIRSFILIFIIQIIVFIPSFIFKTEHYFDLTGGITFIIVILYAFYEKFQIIEFSVHVQKKQIGWYFLLILKIETCSFRLIY